MILEILSGFTRALLYIILAELFWGKEKVRFMKWSKFLTCMVIIVAYLVSNIWAIEWIRGFLSVEIVVILIIYGVIDNKKIGWIQLIGGATGAYIFSLIINAVIALIFGSLTSFTNVISNVAFKYVICILFRVIASVLIYNNYDWAMKQSKKKGTNIIMLVGALVIFFQQFFQIAYIDKNYSFAMMVILLFYLTMIFTAFMLLQHNRLTAKQQAIEEDNRQMSQRLHRSKDVLGVVS